ncbi:MAG: ABC transporter permease [Rhodospirillales bacterium]|jgi:peptide/nickel transport system permease protein|nr:ABC transporter permease [Rhodospirillales bacterium]MBT4038611.1 ABC transporter permease [Rhodospirillales bacterium]MBT4627629.1 ABC transporter permease [Rhodospirillales bacterium]MBT5351548.1 ABC transporter permease [Rhodospirillales bacterium]MBT5521522.1 ABC transporter permease [Rhodospirillales bacterium]
MITYTSSRLFQAAMVLLIMSFVIYGLMGLMPGDPVDILISSDPDITAEDAARLRSLYGLDQPISARYLNWLSALSGGDLGFSRIHSKPVLDVLLPALGATTLLLGISFVLSVVLGLSAGIWAASKPNSTRDYTVNFVAFAGISVPPFWLAILLILLFSVVWGVLPAGGMGTAQATGIWGNAKYLVLPVISLTIASVGSHTRYMRAAMIETLRQDYIRTAHAKGLSPRQVLIGHALRNALLPVTTIVALDFGALFSGALITETIFAYPGMGKMIFDAIMGNDFNLALVALLFATCMTLAGNMLADGAYVLLDPRIKLQGRRT